MSTARICETCVHRPLMMGEEPCRSCVKHDHWEPNSPHVEESEMVNHPKHYNMGNIEPIDVIEDWGLNFNLGSTVKYIARCDYKEQPIQDLEKAAWYLNREIERRKKEHAGDQ